ncbi:MAG: FAD-dependent oxidoreductase [Lachnospiraceae bacterium]|nr:FAD-dependent oxidoreductase [Butyrivibrio sp.]MCM1343793.1 FAD-binding protein [Muribaculaceae bacterium]MCM1411324.1 FAD-dependent oxidoreductase [Lachnospiraceae bacterium]
MLRINQVKIRTDHTEQDLRKKVADMLRIPVGEIRTLTIVRQSIDARKKPEIFYSYTVDVETAGEERLLRKMKGRLQISRAEDVKYRFPESGTKESKYLPVIVGMGPAGLFCGYYLALHGYRPILLERGKCVEERQKDVEAFWRTGMLDAASNVQFGEGGAGAFSDGKLNTLVKDKDGRNREVLETFVKFGAKESIRYEAKPHVGTDVLCHVVRNMRQEILALGGQVRFGSQVTKIQIRNGRITGVEINRKETLPCEQLVLAIGHSARDTFQMLYEKQIPMEAKSFAVGLRVEHPQSMIDESQYGRMGAEVDRLGAAPYKVAAKASNGRGVYSFCMCPGGYVVNASSEPGRTAVNGMSYSGRDGSNANSAIIVSVTPEDFGSDHPLAGVEFQRLLEKRAYDLGGGKIPVQRYGAFRKEVVSGGKSHTASAPKEADPMPDSSLQPQCKGAFCWADVSRILPVECNEAFVEGMEIFGRQIRGFDREDAILSGVESRTSSPVRICRDETLQSKVRGLYPCGEGAGYAGGITSAAMDGLRVAEAIAAEYHMG